jgi:hypothetical protein
VVEGIIPSRVELTVYLTAYDSLSLWYCTQAMMQKPHINRDYWESQMSGNGFRGRVSQVRILPGPLSERRTPTDVESSGYAPATVPGSFFDLLTNATSRNLTPLTPRTSHKKKSFSSISSVNSANV